MRTGLIRGVTGLLLAFIVSAVPAHAENKPTITWLKLDWQPAWINSGPWAGKGYAQAGERMLQARLQEFDHADQSVVNVRIYTVIKTMEACFATAPYRGIDLSPDQRDGLVFSAPTFLFFYHGIIAQEKALPVIQAHADQGRVDFKRLIEDKAARGAFQPGRVYSRWLNDIFANDPNTGNMFRWSGRTSLTQSMFKMMDAGRFDYFVDYYAMLRFHQLTEGNSGHYSYYPILEHENEFGMGGIVCNDTPQGRMVIARINEILSSLRQTDEFTNANAFWLMPPGQEAKYWRLWHQELLTRTD
ncbi:MULTISPECIES: hypothetical protein [Kordiimonas]|uniref:hypothetical protein n=1 Tax=Kordiimonas TaxID=288021 RepID=UPI002580A125|nr:hypothetical protein [Kordiimonas sp. UBA4487]